MCRERLILIIQEICHPERSEGSPARSAGILHSLRSFKNDMMYSDLGTPEVLEVSLGD